MKKQIVLRRLAVFAAMALLCCGAVLINSNARAQCGCLSATTDPNTSLCDDGCYTWDLKNNCPGFCINTITISDTDTVTGGCAVVLTPTHGTWGVTPNSDGSVTLDHGSDPCWDGTSPSYPMQITLCGVHEGDSVLIKYSPGGEGGCYLTVP